MGRLSDDIEKLQVRGERAVMKYNFIYLRDDTNSVRNREYLEQIHFLSILNPITFLFGNLMNEEEKSENRKYHRTRYEADIIFSAKPYKKRFEDEHLTSLLC